jgi:xanthine dehydrogenase iron-sulfur cluster and FAD-binding subunit A
MKSLCDEYILTHIIEEALQFLSEAHGAARIVSSGSDLLLDLQQSNHQEVRMLVDVTEIEEMCALEIRDQSLAPVHLAAKTFRQAIVGMLAEKFDLSPDKIHFSSDHV